MLCYDQLSVLQTIELQIETLIFRGHTVCHGGN